MHRVTRQDGTIDINATTEMERTRRVRSGANRIPAEERRAEILRVATRLFAEKGFVSTTMDDVANAATITKRTLYRYFASKDDLLFEIHDTFSGHVLVPEHEADITDPVPELSRIIRQTVQMVVDHPTEIGVFFEERKHLGPTQSRLIEERRDTFESHVTSIVQAGIDAGTFVDLPARVVAQAILGSVTEMYRWYRPDGALSPDQLAERFTTLFLRGASSARTLSHARPTARPRVRGEAGRDHRERVRDAAITSFAQHGYHATSLRDLAEVAEVTKGAVTYHAGYKNDLLEQIHRVTFQEAILLMQEELANDDESTPALDSLHRLITVHMRFMATSRDAIAAINDNMRYLEPKALRRIEQLRQKWLTAFTSTVDRAAARHELTDVQPDFLVRALVGMFNSAARWFDPRGKLRPDAVAEVFTELLLLGISADGQAVTAAPGR